MVSEDEDDDIVSEEYGGDARSSVECQGRLWGAEPARRDDVLPFFVWSIVHDPRRSEVALKAFLDVSLGPIPSLVGRLGLGVDSHDDRLCVEIGGVMILVV